MPETEPTEEEILELLDETSEIMPPSEGMKWEGRCMVAFTNFLQQAMAGEIRLLCRFLESTTDLSTDLANWGKLANLPPKRPVSMPPEPEPPIERATEEEMSELFDKVRCWNKHDASNNTVDTLDIMEQEGELFMCFADFMRDAITGEKRFLAAILGEWVAKHPTLDSIVVLDPSCDRMRKLNE